MRRGLLASVADRASHFQKSQKLIDRVAKSPFIENDKRTRGQSLITESRLRRAEGKTREAVDAAHRALEFAEASGLGRVDCLITLGEAKLEAGDASGAIDYFERAMGYGRLNRKLLAVGHLHLSRAYLKAGKPSQALEHFHSWQETQPGRENAFIRTLAESIELEVARLTADFTVPRGVPDLTAEIQINRLRKWLAQIALQRESDNYSRASQLLKISESTVKTWLQSSR
jgi:tetratricopeptide (TPR) repeat protein